MKTWSYWFFLPSYMQNRQDNNGIKVLVMKKGNCGDMRKFHVTLHFFKVTVLRSGPQGTIIAATVLLK